MENIDYISKTTELRQHAEEMLESKSGKEERPLSEVEKLSFIHELEVHQIELELQNEELVQAKLAAQNVAKKYSRLYDAAPSGFFTLSTDGKIMEINIVGSQMLGKAGEYLKNKKFALFVSDETRHEFTTFLEQIFETRKKETCEVTFVPEENKLLYAYLTGLAIENGNECLVTAIDITERKKAVQSLIEHQRLSAIGEMASSIAHDFNNSLQSMLGNLEMAMHAPELSESTFQYLKVMKTLVNDVAARVHHLQRSSGLKKDDEPFIIVNLNTLISEVIEQSRPLWEFQASEKGLRIHINTSFDEIPEILGNNGELRTAIYNIIKNSIEAMPHGGEISIKTENKPDGIYALISDTGIGMNEETKARVFQPFYSTKGTDPGRGLGMSGVYSIINEHRGTIAVKETTLGSGTSIEIFFPKYRETEPDKSLKVEEVPKNSNGSVKVLWVEDDESISIIAQEMLKLMGHNGETVSSGKEALQLLDKNNYDIVITDIGMPEMNGWQLANIIKEKFEGKITVAVISGWGNQIKEDEKQKHGVSYVLSKPFNFNQLKNLIEKVGKS